MGGTTPSRSACTVSTASTAPAAPNECPSAAFGAYTAGMWLAERVADGASLGEVTEVVPVACALMWSMSVGVRPASSIARAMASPARLAVGVRLDGVVAVGRHGRSHHPRQDRERRAPWRVPRSR